MDNSSVVGDVNMAVLGSIPRRCPYRSRVVATARDIRRVNGQLSWTRGHTKETDLKAHLNRVADSQCQEAYAQNDAISWPASRFQRRRQVPIVVYADGIEAEHQVVRHIRLLREHRTRGVIQKTDYPMSRLFIGGNSSPFRTRWIGVRAIPSAAFLFDHNGDKVIAKTDGLNSYQRSVLRAAIGAGWSGHKCRAGGICCLCDKGERATWFHMLRCMSFTHSAIDDAPVEQALRDEFKEYLSNDLWSNFGMLPAKFWYPRAEAACAQSAVGHASSDFDSRVLLVVFYARIVSSLAIRYLDQCRAAPLENPCWYQVGDIGRDNFVQLQPQLEKMRRARGSRTGVG